MFDPMSTSDYHNPIYSKYIHIDGYNQYHDRASIIQYIANTLILMVIMNIMIEHPYSNIVQYIQDATLSNLD